VIIPISYKSVSLALFVWGACFGRMAARIAFFGGAGVGKSTLVHSLASFAQKRGRSIGVANFDAGCKHILYKPVFDVRQYYSLRKIILHGDGLREEEALAEIYRRAASDAVFNSDLRRACLGKDAVLLDVAGPLDYFLLRGGKKFLQHFCDKAVFVADYNALRDDERGRVASALNSLIEGALGLPTVTFINKCEVLEKKRRRLLQKSLFEQEESQKISNMPLSPSFVGGKLFKGSAVEGMGQKELFAALEL